MTGRSSVDISILLQWIGASILILGCLAALLALATSLLRHVVRRNVLRASKSLVGQRGEVTKTIRVNHVGQVRCNDELGAPRLVEAVSDRRIGRGEIVLITAEKEGQYRVLPVEPAGPAQKPAAGT